MVDLNLLDRLEPLKTSGLYLAGARRRRMSRRHASAHVFTNPVLGRWSWCTPDFLAPWNGWTGKSTIARTVTSRFDKRERLVGQGQLPSNVCLGATFFFRRTKQRRNYVSTLFPTLARQLVDALPDLSGPICDVIRTRHSITADRLAVQWRDLSLTRSRSLEGDFFLIWQSFWLSMY